LIIFLAEDLVVVLLGLEFGSPLVVVLLVSFFGLLEELLLFLDGVLLLRQ